MPKDAAQNPRNKVGRNSGAGRTGISALAPTRREAERGLEPLSLDRTSPGRLLRLGLGLGAVVLFGAGLAVYRMRRAREERTLRSRIRRSLRLD